MFAANAIHKSPLAFWGIHPPGRTEDATVPRGYHRIWHSMLTRTNKRSLSLVRIRIRSKIPLRLYPVGIIRIAIQIWELRSQLVTQSEMSHQICKYQKIQYPPGFVPYGIRSCCENHFDHIVRRRLVGISRNKCSQIATEASIKIIAKMYRRNNEFCCSDFTKMRYAQVDTRNPGIQL